MDPDLFDDDDSARQVPLAPGAMLLRGFACADAPAFLAGVHEVIAAAPLRHMVTPGGQPMSVAMTNCARLGWVSDRSGYRYDRLDPLSGKPWPPMPPRWRRLAAEAAATAGFAGFEPDACLVNRYEPGTRLSLHQDRDERDLRAPIVSVSLGIAAVFLFGGDQRSDRCQRIALQHGDVVVWGGPSRLRHHGVLPLAQAVHPLTGSRRFNLTFRQAA